MPPNPYAPPKSDVADVLPIQPKRWGRAAWLHLPAFGIALASGFTAWGIVSALTITTGLLYFSFRSLTTLRDNAPPWWTDVLYYGTVAIFLAGLAYEEASLVVVGGAPTILLNGAAGLLALVIERRHGVRIYISGRRYVFSPKRAL
jgi:hypothetical protein